ncbi:hypothetical protein GXM_09610 [Nostoc sphaeroides CCNUC1]|uniref:Uncharacterized protein n=1 Tax=Nostoc sphaeroides CCNUC1 TaxID=2653204 RepID=A0A5P8WJ02_9NOSO|nr:hypothetical protein GXM_09610 [Nostoc sphaeroides CCNUC1]
MPKPLLLKDYYTLDAFALILASMVNLLNIAIINLESGFVHL